jgi:endonuclease-3
VRFVPSAAKARGAADPARAAEVLRRLRAEFPEATTALSHHCPFELLVATILSAQCTDARVNQVTPKLFATYPGPREMAAAPLPMLEELVKTTGFFRMKAKSIQGVSRALVEKHGGQVPSDMETLVSLPGVGRKTANCVLGTAFGKSAMVVDTHVSRLARRLGWSRHEDPEKIERDLMALLPQRDWVFAAHALILHGRRTCRAQRPRCRSCVLGEELCPSFDPKAPT